MVSSFCRVAGYAEQSGRLYEGDDSSDEEYDKEECGEESCSVEEGAPMPPT
jgi:hypothetical protein